MKLVVVKVIDARCWRKVGLIFSNRVSILVLGQYSVELNTRCAFVTVLTFICLAPVYLCGQS